jgi:hypothetical protein
MGGQSASSWRALLGELFSPRDGRYVQAGGPPPFGGSNSFDGSARRTVHPRSQLADAGRRVLLVDPTDGK